MSKDEGLGVSTGNFYCKDQVANTQVSWSLTTTTTAAHGLS